MSWESRSHFRQRTFRQHVGSFPIGGGVGGGRNLGAGVADIGCAGGGGGGDGVASKDVVGGLGAAGEPGVAIDGGEGRVVVVGLVDGEGGAGGGGVQERGDSCKSLSSPSHRSNSTLAALLHCLARAFSRRGRGWR